MIEIIKNNTNFKFTKYFNLALISSGILLVFSIWAISYKLNMGVDFRGGTEIQVRFQKMVALDTLRNVLSTEGFPNATVQTIGEEGQNEVLIKISGTEETLNKLTEQATLSLQKKFSAEKIEIDKVDIVGPKAGSLLRNSAVLSMVWALVAIMLYLALRFDFIFAPGAVFALIHDSVIALGLFAVTGADFSLQVVAALLALIGYSVNDTVVIYDRIREHQQKDKTLPLKNHLDDAINQTLSRTFLTSGATFAVCVTMYFLGGASIKDFFFIMSVGIIVGTYSTVFIASPVTLYFAKLIKREV